jgi:hypothetical protein
MCNELLSYRVIAIYKSNEINYKTKLAQTMLNSSITILKNVLQLGYKKNRMLRECNIHLFPL